MCTSTLLLSGVTTILFCMYLLNVYNKTRITFMLWYTKLNGIANTPIMLGSLSRFNSVLTVIRKLVWIDLLFLSILQIIRAFFDNFRALIIDLSNQLLSVILFKNLLQLLKFINHYRNGRNLLLQHALKIAPIKPNDTAHAII